MQHLPARRSSRVKRDESATRVQPAAAEHAAHCRPPLSWRHASSDAFTGAVAAAAALQVRRHVMCRPG